MLTCLSYWEFDMRQPWFRELMVWEIMLTSCTIRGFEIARVPAHGGLAPAVLRVEQAENNVLRSGSGIRR
jgi:hypothetical protein